MKSSFKLNTMSNKLLLILMCMAIFSTTMVAVVFSAYEIVTAEREQKQSLQNMGDILAPNITAALLFDDQDSMDELLRSLLLQKDVVQAEIIDAHLHTAVQIKRDKLNRDIDKKIKIISQLSLDEQIYGSLIIWADDSVIKQHIKIYAQFLAILLLLTFGFSLFLSLILQGGFLRPLLHLSEIAGKVTSSNNYSLRAYPSSVDEVANLTHCFNSMLEKIELRDRKLESDVKERTQDLETANQQLFQYAYKDGLTGLSNRHFFYEKLKQLVDAKQQLSMIFLDLDCFKEINDTLGHDYGDILLSQAGARLVRCVKEKDIVARLGGDEFIIILKGATNKSVTERISNSVLDCLSEPFEIKNETAHVSASIGITLFPQDSQSVKELVKYADLAMYESKRSGKNCYRFFSTSMQEEAQNKRRLAEELRIALTEHQFELYYQPITNTQKNQDGWQIDKAEALIRWNHPQRGLIYPGDFIQDAEDNGLIRELSQWVMNETVSTLANWHSRGIPPLQVSINTSPLQFEDGGRWIDDWLQVISAHHLPPHSLIVEITENALMCTDASIKEQLARLHQAGIDIAIDDFGVGYSSLAYLQQLDIDYLKIDRSFIQHLSTNQDSATLIKAIVTMAHHLDLKVVAEGVETEQQRQHILSVDGDFIQGYLVSQAIPKEAFYHRYLSPSRIELPA